MNYPKVSIITVTYNAAQELCRTLENISAVDYPNLEVVVIDGASTDSTPEVVEKFRNIISYYASEPDRGIYDAMNKGIEASTGDYFWFINAGDLIHDPGVLSKIFSNNHAPADIYYGDTLIRSETGRVMGLRRKKLPAKLSARSFRRGMTVCHQSIIVSRRVAPLYDLHYHYAADIEWVLTSLERSAAIVNTGAILSEFFEGGTSSKKRRESLRERFSIMRRHYGLLPTILSHAGFVFDLFGPKYRKIF